MGSVSARLPECGVHIDRHHLPEFALLSIGTTCLTGGLCYAGWFEFKSRQKGDDRVGNSNTYKISLQTCP